jgi:hypothetical protein
VTGTYPARGESRVIQLLPLRWGALAVLTPFPVFVGGLLQGFRLDELQVLGALTAGTAFGILGLVVVWAAPPGALGSVLGGRLRAVPVSVWVCWAVALGLFNFVWVGHALAWIAIESFLTSTPVSPPLPTVSVAAVAGAIALVIGLVLWQRFRPRVLVGIAVLTIAAWLATLPFLLALPMGLELSQLPGSPNTVLVPAASAHIYLIRMVNVAGMAAATVLLAAPLAKGSGGRPAARRWPPVWRAALVGTVLLTLMYIGLHVGVYAATGVVDHLPRALWAVGAFGLLGGVVLWTSTIVATLPEAWGGTTPGWVWGLLAAVTAGLACAIAYDSSGSVFVVASESHLLALGYLVAPWLGLLLGQRLMHGGPDARGPRAVRPGWAAAAWTCGLAACLPGITGFGLVPGGVVLRTVLPNWRWMGWLHPQLDWALAAGFAGALALYTAGCLFRASSGQG